MASSLTELQKPKMWSQEIIRFLWAIFNPSGLFFSLLYFALLPGKGVQAPHFTLILDCDGGDLAEVRSSAWSDERGKLGSDGPQWLPLWSQPARERGSKREHRENTERERTQKEREHRKRPVPIFWIFPCLNHPYFTGYKEVAGRVCSLICRPISAHARLSFLPTLTAVVKVHLLLTCPLPSPGQNIQSTYNIDEP